MSTSDHDKEVKKGRELPKKIRKAYEAWQQQTLNRGGKPPKLLNTGFVSSDARTPPDLDVPGKKPVKTYLEQVGFPGQYPYTRGVHATMERFSSRSTGMRVEVPPAAGTLKNRLFR